jgi:hypothetical protein
MADKNKRVLGRGLDAILQSPETDITSKDISGDFVAGAIAEIDINLKKEIKAACLSLLDSVCAKVDANILPFTTGTILNDLAEEVHTLSGYVENVIEARLGIGRITGNRTLKNTI